MNAFYVRDLLITPVMENYMEDMRSSIGGPGNFRKSMCGFDQQIE